MDIIFSIVLMIFCICCFFLAGAETPDTMPAELGAAFWPRIILVLMAGLLALNLIQDLMAPKDREKKPSGKNVTLFAGMVLTAGMALMMGLIGFIPDCLLFLAAYGYLLGERRIPLLAFRSLAITMVLYVLFRHIPSIRLAGGVGPFYEFAQFVDGLMPF